MHHQNDAIKVIRSVIILVCCFFRSDIDDFAPTNTLGFVGAFTIIAPTTTGIAPKTKSMPPPPPVSSISSSSSNYESTRRRRRRSTIATRPSILSPSRSTACFAALEDGAGSDDVSSENNQTSSDNTEGGSVDNSSASTSQRPNKLDLYEEDELASLLQLHTNLYPSMTETTNKRIKNQDKDSTDDNNGPDFPSLHDLVMQTIEEIDDGDLQRLPEANVENDIDDSSPSSSTTSWLSSSVESKLPSIRAIASDVDGTILDTKDQQVHPRTQQSIIQAVELARENRDAASSNPPSSSLQWFFPATGKSRAGALKSLGPELSSVLRNGPGVYCQGLYCVGKDGKTIVFEKKLTMDAIVATEQLVEFTGTSVIAYDGDSLFTTDLNPTVLELHEKWGEPLSTQIGSIAGHPNGVHKILVCDMDEMKLRNLVRPQLEQIATETGSVVTQAIPTMLEILPEGCSKAYGVQKVCEELGIDDPGTQLLAIGDAENDVGMLQMASVGVAVGDANDLAKAAADVVVPLTSCEGGAGLTIEKVLQQKQ